MAHEDTAYRIGMEYSEKCPQGYYLHMQFPSFYPTDGDERNLCILAGSDTQPPGRDQVRGLSEAK
jgi:hypothetical protein